MRLQVALNVHDMDSAVAFYSKMFGVEPNKRKPGYANFAIDKPPLKLVLFEAPGTRERLNHLGVEVFDDAEVRDATERIRAGGLNYHVQPDTVCCHARQNKVWAQEPEGLSWEWYRVIEDVESRNSAANLQAADTSDACCMERDLYTRRS